MPLGNGWKSAVTLVVGGLIGVVLAPSVAPALGRLIRPAAKAGLRAGWVLFERGRVAAAELRETVEDITAEVRAEIEEERGMQQTAAAGTAEEAIGSDVVH